jgi:hypothetical protein
MNADPHAAHEHSGPGYASPEVAREQPPERFVYIAALYEGTDRALHAGRHRRHGVDAGRRRGQPPGRFRGARRAPAAGRPALTGPNQGGSAVRNVSRSASSPVYFGRQPSSRLALLVSMIAG